MASTTDHATTRDSVRILTRHWTAEGPRAGVLLVHGLGEHSARYEHVGDQLAAAGLETFAWDHRGFGASAGERAWVDRWSRFHDDVEDRLAAVRAAVPRRPVILYGHSMGGLIALGFCVSEPPRPLPDLLVLSAPAIDDGLAAWKHRIAPALARFVPRVRIANGVDPGLLSRDPARQEAARTDPLMVNSTTARLGALGFAEQSRVRGAMAGLSLPTLVIQGMEDAVVPARVTEPLGFQHGVIRRAYARIRHELHNEPEGPQILGDVIAWIDERLAALPQPAGAV